MLSKIESRWWMYVIGWLVPLFVVGISAGYGLPNEVYIEPLVCEEGQLLYLPPSYSANGSSATFFLQFLFKKYKFW